MSEIEQFKKTYFAECSELIAEAEEHFSALNRDPQDHERVHAVFRAVHSVKGGAGAFGFDDLVAFAHAFETMLDLLRERRVELTHPTITLCMRGLDALADLVAAARGGSRLSSQHGADVLREIKTLCAPIAISAPTNDRPAGVAPGDTNRRRWTIRFKPHRALFERANEPLLLLRELRTLGAATVVAEIDADATLANYDATRPLIGWVVTLDAPIDRSEIEAVFEFVDGDCDLMIEEREPGEADAAMSRVSDERSALTEVLELPTAPTTDDNVRSTTADTQATSIRVDLEKVDRVADMVGELVVTQAMLFEQVDDHFRERYIEVVRGLEALAQHTRALQDSVMSIRAQPVKTVFARMSRLVRELSAQLGKKVRLETIGEMTEIDKTVVEQLSDPLTHMVRNSLDHGIEPPEMRRAVGKPEVAVLRLAASQVGGRIVIRVSDDGGGIDRERVLRRAIDRGLVAADAMLPGEQIDELIFTPGFTTVDTVTDLSGRGVGMDVVRRNVHKLGGRVSVKSVPGEGVTMTLTLPLSLAVLDVMLVRSGATSFVLPLASIVESMPFVGTSIGHLPSGNRVLRTRGGYVPVIDIARLFDQNRVPTEDAPEGFLILCEADGGRCVALHVDQIVGQQQAVIKSIETNFERIEGIAGATILGDGSVSLILDIAGLERLSEKKSATRLAA